MRKYILVLLISLVSVTISQSQNPKQTKKDSDAGFTYKKIEILDKKEGELPLVGALNSTANNQDPYNSSNRNSGDSGVGETMGALSVSLTGGATYNVPIAVPPGINGVVPEIALSYNSQSGNGIAGYGWNISGISTITRIPSTKFHDNNIDEVDFDNLDRFALDGKRLILKSGTYGGDGAQYETETFSNLKITSHDNSPYGANFGPSYFKVQYPDGSIAYYGYNGNSRTKTSFAVSYWQNPQGIRVIYEYLGAELSIHKIKYGSRLSSAPINMIQFNYSSRKRKEQAFVNGVSFLRRNRLKSISVFSGSSVNRTYNLGYNFTNLQYDRLTSITESSGSSIHSPINFNYSNSPTSAVSYNETTTTLNLSNIEQRNAESISLDFTGNGKMDFIVYPKKAIDRNKFWLYKDLQSGTNNNAYQIDIGGFNEIFPANILTHQNKVMPSQGLAIVEKLYTNQVKFKMYTNGGASGGPISHQYSKTWDAPTYQLQTSPTNSITKEIPKEYVSGDFNGDGLTDILAIGKPYLKNYCYEITCPDGIGGGGGGGDPIPIAQQPDESDENFKQRKQQELNLEGDHYRAPGGGDEGGGGNKPCYKCNSYTYNYKTVYFIDLKRDVTSGFVTSAGHLLQHISPDDKILTADFNGDGKSDIIHVSESKLRVYGLDNNNQLTQLWEKNNPSNFNVDYPLLLGDYNGDGKTDFLRPTMNNSNVFSMYMSNGSDFDVLNKSQEFTFKEAEWNSTFEQLITRDLVPLDINGDGRTDIIEYISVTYNNSNNGYQKVKVYNNIGLGSSYVPQNIKLEFGGEVTKSGNVKHFPIPIYLTSNTPNKSLEFATISNQWVTSFSFSMDHREDMLLRSVNNNGVTQNIYYNNLDHTEPGQDYSELYQYNSQQTYPYMDIQMAPGTKIVSSLHRVVSGTPTLKQIYGYYGAVSNLNGLGFIGFEGIATSNWHTNNSDRIFSVSKFDPSLRGALKEEYVMPNYFTFSTPSSGYITKTSYTNAFSLSSSKVFKLWNTSSLNQNSLNQTFTNTSYLYDSYNNPIKITTNYSGHGSSVMDLAYDDNLGSNYYIGRLLTEKETKTIAGNSFSSEKQFVYDGYLIDQIKTKGNGTLFDIEDYDYDAFGNVVTKTTTPNGEQGRQISFLYDSSGRFMEEYTDIEGLVTTYDYNYNTGVLEKEISPFGHITEYDYDHWNRPIEVKDFLGKKLTTTYVESSNNYYTVTDTGDDGTGSITIYDPLKRVTTVKEKNVLGQWVSKSYEYDKFDRPYKESEPYIGGAASQWNETEFDFYGRPIKQTLHTGRVINISYSGLTVVVDDGTKTTTTVKNAMDKTLSVNDPGGTINYTYFGNGRLKTANYNGVVVSTEQDGWGRKTKTIDPSAGTYTYAYNGFGQVVNETTPKGTTDYTYSPLGKLQQKHILGDNTDMTTNYSYSSSNKLPTSMTVISADGNNSSYAYTYDNQERLNFTSEINTHAKFTKRLTYDDFGRVETEESYAELLTNGKNTLKKVKNVYQNGALKTIKDNTTNEVLWNLSTINARGQATSVTMGNNLRENSTYNAYGYLTENKVEKNINSSPVELMKLTNDFNSQRGILNNRTNSMFSWSEDFTYDNQDRLVNFDDNNGDNQHDYDVMGRITASNIAGTYNYSGSSYKLNYVDLNNQGDLYYQQNAQQQVTYNAFKKPVSISEQNKEKIGFQYNAFKGRSHMFYGDTQSDIYLRNNRKHYSFDGTMEISFDQTTNKTTFVNYIGGNAYTAPTIWRSEKILNNVEEAYYYLHRDYLGSIMMISDKDGNIKEKRHFDAWGNVVKVADGNNITLDKLTFLDRGYTGHEHLQGVNLIHMNGRLYDPKLRRFLSPDNYIQDPFNTQSFNRYGYAWNNPLMYTDPSGEFLFGLEWAAVSTIVKIAAVIFAASATVGAFALIANLHDQSSSSGPSDPNQNLTPSSQNGSSDIATNGFRIPDSGYRLDYQYGVSPAITAQPNATSALNPFNAVNDAMFDAMFGNVQNGNNLEGDNGGLDITVGDVADTVTDFIPFVGSGKDLYNGIKDGDGWMIALGVGGLILDVATLGTASLVKGAIKTGVKQGVKAYGKNVVKQSAKKVNRIYSAKVLTKETTGGTFHRFPELFNKTIFEQGTKTITNNYFKVAKKNLSNTNILYELPGSINGTKGVYTGVYEIATRLSKSGATEVINHRFFKKTGFIPY